MSVSKKVTRCGSRCRVASKGPPRCIGPLEGTTCKAVPESPISISGFRTAPQFGVRVLQGDKNQGAYWLDSYFRVVILASSWSRDHRGASEGLLPQLERWEPTERGGATSGIGLSGESGHIFNACLSRRGVLECVARRPVRIEELARIPPLLVVQVALVDFGKH